MTTSMSPSASSSDAGGEVSHGMSQNGISQNGSAVNGSASSLLGTPAWRLSDAFDRAAPSYDAMVALSPGYHDQLRRSAEALMARAALPVDRPMRIADLGCGSGASTAALLEAATAAGVTDALVTGVDASSGMLAEAARKSWPESVTFVEKDALGWLRAQPDGGLDAVLAAYLLRNVTERDAIVAELARVLVPGGAVALQDYSVAGRPLVGALWAGVCHAVIIPLAVISRSDVQLHRYLYRSVRDFDSVEVIHDRLARAGLQDPQHVRHSGWQRTMVHTLTAVAP
jgi:ubiquinone/menaquinone biosynthesis C-methylase UbiE